MERMHFVSAHFGGKAPWKNHVESDRFQVTNSFYDDSNYSSRHLAMHPRLKAKIPKMLEWKYVEADWYVWVDSSIRLRGNKICDWIEKTADGKELCLFKHSYANSIREEVNRVRDNLDRSVSYIKRRYSGEPLLEQLVYYYGDKNFVDDRLFGMTMFAYKRSAAPLMQEWFNHNVEWSIQDQISFPYVLSKFEYEYSVFDCLITDENNYFEWDWKRREQGLKF